MGKFKIGDHALDGEQLLIIFAPEVSAVGRNDFKELEHDGGDAAEVAGTELAFPALGNACDFDVRREAGRKDFAGGRGEDEIHAKRRELRQIAFQIARIFLVIFARAELLGIHENGDDRNVAFLLRALDEA